MFRVCTVQLLSHKSFSCLPFENVSTTNNRNDTNRYKTEDSFWIFKCLRSKTLGCICQTSMSLNLSCVCEAPPVVTVILLHQGGMWPEHQFYFTGTAIDHRVPAPVLSSVVHVQTAVVTRLGALNARTCLLGENIHQHWVSMMTKIPRGVACSVYLTTIFLAESHHYTGHWLGSTFKHYTQRH